MFVEKELNCDSFSSVFSASNFSSREGDISIRKQNTPLYYVMPNLVLCVTVIYLFII